MKIKVQGQPIEILALLLDRPGQVVTREEIQRKLWPEGTNVEFEHSLNAAVKRLRDALDDSPDSPRYIETVPRRGYRFMGRNVSAFAVHGAEPAASSGQDLVPAQGSAEAARSKRRARYIALAVVLILGIVAAGWWRVRPFGAGAVPRIDSVVVLPLTNLSHDPEQDYFADGMTETLIADLAQVRALRVISRTSAMHYRGSNKTLPEIARELNVDAVIEGTVQRSGNRVRVTAELIHGQTDAHLWTKTYERDSQDVLEMQSELAQAIAGEIKVRLTPDEQQHLSSARPVNPDAYNAYLLGEFHCAKRNPPAIEKCVQYLQDAIRLDLSYARAHAGLADAYFEREIWGGGGFGKSADQIRAATLKALELDPNLADVHELLARIHYQYDWDWERTELEFKRAIALNPSLPDSYDFYSFYLQTMGRQEEALATVHRAVELDPLSPWYLSDEGRILFRARQYENAVTRYQRALELDPGFVPALARMADAYEQLGKFDEALAYEKKSEQAMGSKNAIRTAEIYARMGKKSEALALLRTLETQGSQGVLGSDNTATAVTYFALGDKDRAFAALRIGVESHSMFPFVLVDPRLDPMRSDPRFRELLRRANIPT